MSSLTYLLYLKNKTKNLFLSPKLNSENIKEEFSPWPHHLNNYFDYLELSPKLSVCAYMFYVITIVVYLLHVFCFLYNIL